MHSPLILCNIQIKMDFGELLRKRLKMAASAAQQDGQNSQSIRNLLAVMAECLCQQATALEVVQSEMAGKVDQHELQQALGQKLSLKEFLAYFRKVEKVVEKMEAHWASGESRTQEYLDDKVKALSQQLYSEVEVKMDSLTSQNRQHQIWLLETRSEIETLGRALDQVQGSVQQSLEELRGELQLQRSRCAEQRRQEKSEVVLNEVKQMQVYLNETHNEINQLLQSIAKEGRIKDHHTGISIEERFAALEQMTGVCQEGSPSRWMWELSQTNSLENHLLAGRLVLQTLGQGRAGVRVDHSGLYRVTWGYLIAPSAQGQLVVGVQCQQLCSSSMQAGPRRGLLRSSMLYCYLKKGSVLSLGVYSRSKQSGFFEVQPL